MTDKHDAESQPSIDDTPPDTPTHSSQTKTLGVPALEDYLHFLPGQGVVDSPPWPGRTYMIRHRASDRILARDHGRLELKEPADLPATCAWRWTCAENDGGWLGFYEPSSGAYLGRDNRGGFRASTTSHSGESCLDVRAHPDGGCQIMFIHWWTRMRMVANVMTGVMAEVAGSVNAGLEASLWDFVQV